MKELLRTDSGFTDVTMTKDALEEFIGKMEPFSGSWVHFRSDETFGLSKIYSNEITPHAIYGLDVSRLLMMAKWQLETRTPNKTFFHNIGFNRRPTAIIFDVDGAVVSGAPYADYLEHWTALRSYVSENYAMAVDTVESFWPREHYVDHVALSALLYVTEKACDAILQPVENGPFKPHPDKPMLWREFLVAAGVDAIEDRAGALTGDCDHQIAVVNPAVARIVSSFDNPLSTPVVATPKLK